MKRFFSLVFILSLICSNLLARDDSGKIVRGYDGGMMLHTGYISGTNMALGNKAAGMPMGIGGAIRMHVGNHFRLGTEGYTSSLSLRDNGSYVKCFWAGLLADWRWTWGRWVPYAGVTVGGGKLTTFLMNEGRPDDWTREEDVVFNKQAFVAVDPFVGCDYMVSDAFHLTLKVDCLYGLGADDLYMPVGPRCYLGFIFFH